MTGISKPTLRAAFALAVAALALAAPTANALNVVEPTGNNDVVGAGRDYATQVLNNPWDMSDIEDVELARSLGLASESIVGGFYNGITTNGDPAFYLLDEGLAGTTNLSRGEANPIVTANYRYLTLKLRYTATAPGVTDPQGLLVYFYENGSSTANLRIGFTHFFAVNLGAWQIVTIDLATQTNPASSFTWSSFPTVKGLRIDPATAANVKVEMDWARLTASTPGPATESFTVTWNDTQSGTYTISAIDGDGAVLPLATNVTGTSRQVSLANLVPGPYRIRVSRSGATADSAGIVQVNAPPVASATQPSARGDTANSYSIARFGRPWGPFVAADIFLAPNVTNLRFNDPPGSGSVAGRPTNDDPSLIMQTNGAPVDANTYRSLCFVTQNHVPDSFPVASMVRILWGDTLTSMTATKDVFLKRGLNEYCIPDLAAVPVEPGAPKPWAGNVTYLRYDPHEMPVPPECATAPSPVNCREFRLDRLTLSPFVTANANAGIAWTLQDADTTTATTRVYLDPDRDRSNANEQLVWTGTSTRGSNSALVPVVAVVPGVYYVALEVDDGLNTVRSYSSGPLRVLPAVDLVFRNGFQP